MNSMMKYLICILLMVIWLSLNEQGVCSPAAGLLRRRGFSSERPADHSKLLDGQDNFDPSSAPLKLQDVVPEANSKSSPKNRDLENPGKEPKKMDAASPPLKGNEETITSERPAEGAENLDERGGSRSGENAVPERDTPQGGGVRQQIGEGKKQNPEPMFSNERNTPVTGLKPADVPKEDMSDPHFPNTAAGGSTKADNKNQEPVEKDLLDGDGKPKSSVPPLTPSNDPKSAKVEVVSPVTLEHVEDGYTDSSDRGPIQDHVLLPGKSDQEDQKTHPDGEGGTDENGAMSDIKHDDDGNGGAGTTIGKTQDAENGKETSVEHSKGNMDENDDEDKNEDKTETLDEEERTSEMPTISEEEDSAGEGDEDTNEGKKIPFNGNNTENNAFAGPLNESVTSTSSETENVPNPITQKSLITTRSTLNVDEEAPPPVTYFSQVPLFQSTGMDRWGYPTTSYGRQLQTSSDPIPPRMPYNPYYTSTMFRPYSNYITDLMPKRLQQTTSGAKSDDDVIELETTPKAAEKPVITTPEETTAAVAVPDTTSALWTSAAAATVQVTTTSAPTTVPEVTTSSEALSTKLVVVTSLNDIRTEVDAKLPAVTTTQEVTTTPTHTEATFEDNDVDSHSRKRPPIEGGAGREGGSNIHDEDNVKKETKPVSVTSKPQTNALNNELTATSPVDTSDIFGKTEIYVRNMVKQMGTLKVSLILLMIIGLSFLSIFCCCRICKRKKYRMRQRKLKEFGQEKEFLLRDRKGNKYNNDTVTLLEGSSEDEF